MKMNKISISIAALLTSAALLAGCGNVEHASEASQAETASAAFDAQTETVTETQTEAVSEAPAETSEAQSESSSANEESEYVQIKISSNSPYGHLGISDPDNLDCYETMPAHEYTRPYKKGQKFSFCANADIGYRLVEWTKNGEHFAEGWSMSDSSDTDASYTAVFETAKPAKLGEYDTLGELLDSLGECSYTGLLFNDKHFVYDFACDDVYYRATLEITPEVYDKFKNICETAYNNEEWVDLSEDDDEGDTVTDGLRPLKLLSVKAMSDEIVFPEKLSGLVGKTGAELFSSGWRQGRTSWSDDGVALTTGDGFFTYSFKFSDMDSLSEDPTEEELSERTVTSAHIYGLEYLDVFMGIPWEE